MAMCRTYQLPTVVGVPARVRPRVRRGGWLRRGWFRRSIRDAVASDHVARRWVRWRQRRRGPEQGRRVSLWRAAYRH
ncbi:hypothetical protein FBU59_000120 [Linderina macrospora]|uniref:Uncharacterized protein n=1 Tax=Linderina macrospora TaxID=4868 RepID=A0ACC1JHQ5_9FUNG|nr:hypothetical protein FBU59_000120 [Linderina macrospora]